MASRLRRTLATLAGLAAATRCSYAGAQPDVPTRSASAASALAGATPSAASAPSELAAGDRAARAKQWPDALAHYARARAAAPGARAQLGVASALYQLDRAGEAYEAYSEALTAYGSQLAPADKALAAGRVGDLARRTGWLSIRVGEPGASVEVDGGSFGVSPVPALLRVRVGSHVVRVTKDGFIPFETRGDVAPDGKTLVEVTLVRAPTQGHLVVRASGDPIRVLLDGVDVGATPWEGDVPPGPHEVSGRSSTSVAQPQEITVTAGATGSVELVAASTAAHLELRTSDGQGLVVVDGSPRGQGEFAADLPPGLHTVTISRDGYETYRKVLSLAPRQTWVETVTLAAAAVHAAVVSHAERPIEGVYGGLGLSSLFGIGGQGTELETGCSALGASSCSTPSPAGGGLFGYFGWTWNPVGFELLVGSAFDTVRQTATYSGAETTTSSPYSAPARVETFHFYRAGGLAALRARALFALGSRVRATVAGGVGVSYERMLMTRRAVASDGAQDFYVPDSVGYVSPAITAELGVQVRMSATLALALGVLLWADNASIAGSDAVPAQAPRSLVAANQAPQPIPTPEYHLASGPQVLLGPFVGLQFGP